MKFAVAGGGAAGLGAALILARAGHEAVVVERDAVGPEVGPEDAFAVPRGGIPHFLQPHSFLPRGRAILRRVAPDVLDALLEVGAEEQDIAAKLSEPRELGDEDLVYLWVRRPLIEWALRRAVAAEPAAELRAGTAVAGVVVNGDRATGLELADGEELPADLVVDALGRTRPPAGWPRTDAQRADCGVVYYSRYFALEDGVEFPPGPWLINPRGDLGFMAFNTFRGDNRTFAAILLTPGWDHELRALRDETAWMVACAQIRPLDELTAPDFARPITDVLPMGGLANLLRTDPPPVAGVIPLGDAVCHTNPAYAFGLSMALAQAETLGRVASATTRSEDVPAAYLAAVAGEATERHAFSVATDAARQAVLAGERPDLGRRDASYPLFAFATALAAAPHDDLVLRRTVRRIGLLDRTAVFDEDEEVHDRIEEIWAELTAAGPPPPPGPPREELLAAMNTPRARRAATRASRRA